MRMSTDSSSGHVPGRCPAWPQGHVEQGRDLSGDAVDRRQVGPVVARLDLEHVVAERQNVGERCAGPCEASRSMIPPWSVPSSSSSSARIMPSETSPRSLRLSIVEAARHDRARQRDRDRRAGVEVPGAADDLARLPLADVDLGQLQLSASGCFSASSTRPTRKRSKFPSRVETPRWTMRSTSQLVKTSCRASSSSGQVECRHIRASQLAGTFIASPGILELVQHSEVVLPEDAQIGQPVAEHRDPLDAEAEGEARPLLGVEPTLRKTSGSTQPAPPISIHPECLQIAQP